MKNHAKQQQTMTNRDRERDRETDQKGFCLSGVHPEKGDGQVRIRLTETSTEVLEKANSLPKWQVAPPMTRGAKASTQENGNTIQSEKKTKRAKTVKCHIKKPRMQAAKPVVPVSQMDENVIRRTNAGRAAIKELMKNLSDLHAKVYPDSPAFDDHGRCKIPGAKQATWQDLLDASPAGFESLRLGCFLLSFFLF